MHKNKMKTEETPCGQRMIFTGPDGIGDYRPKSGYFPWYVGVGAASPEGSSDATYLWRAAPHTPTPLPRCAHVGEVGWGLQYHLLLNSGTLFSNMQIKKTDVRTAVEDRLTNTFQPTKHTTAKDVRQNPARATATGTPPDTDGRNNTKQSQIPEERTFPDDGEQPGKTTAD